jgi:cell division protein FtsZ
MKGAKGVIISITGGEDMRLMEVDEAASHIKELVDPDANIIWGSAFNNDLDGKIRVSVVATGIEAEEATKPTSGSATTSAASSKVFTFPTRTASVTTATTTATAAPATPVTPPVTDETDGDELLLDSEDILTTPVGTPPIAPPRDEETAPLKAQPQAGTLFERMSSMARGAGKVEEEPTPSLRREPLDIPRFLNRQNNQ